MPSFVPTPVDESIIDTVSKYPQLHFKNLLQALPFVSKASMRARVTALVDAGFLHYDGLAFVMSAAGREWATNRQSKGGAL